MLLLLLLLFCDALTRATYFVVVVAVFCCRLFEMRERTGTDRVLHPRVSHSLTHRDFLVLISLCSPSHLLSAAAGMAIKRERCDSLPSRNRTISDSGNASSLTTSSSTTMPPPKTIPSWNRPVSMCNRPSNSPISPSICSESGGSSISIDEPDGLPAHCTATTSSTPDDNGGFFHRYAG